MTPKPPRAPAAGSIAPFALLIAALALFSPKPAAGDAPDSSLTARWSQVVREDLDRFWSRPTAVVVAAGGTLTGISFAIEDGNDLASHMTGSGWEHLADVGNVYGHAAFLGGASITLAATGHWTGHDRVRQTGIESCRSLLYTYMMVGGLKLTIPRTRPNGEDRSFPSGHTAGAFAVAPVLARRWGPVAAVPAYALAVVTGLARIQSRSHYLSDVVFGATIGTAAGLAVARPDPPGSGARLLIESDRAGVAVRF